MKKILLFTAVLSAFSFASCKKEHTCTCTDASTATTLTTWDAGNTETSSSSDSNTDTYIIVDAKKKDAKKACIDNSTTDTYEYDSYGLNPSNSNFEDNTNVVTTKNESTCDIK